ncbi:WXG100 family type VII secretion target [Streptomyces sp. NPDC054956]
MATDFEGHTHQELLAMLASADAETLRARGAQLTDAAAAIKEIGESLKEHRVTGWEGESSQAFQDWVSRTGNAALRLSEYCAAGGKQMTQAGQVVIEVKANMPAYDTGAESTLAAAREFHNDPDAQQIGQRAHAKLSGDRQQAIQQMTKLAQGYEASATGMEMAEVPTFPVLPQVFVPQGKDAVQQWERSGSHPTGSVGMGGAAHAPVMKSPGGASYDFGSTAGPVGVSPTTTSPAPDLVLPDRIARVGLDNVGTLPDRTLPPAGVSGGAGPIGPGGGGLVVPPSDFIPPPALLPVGGIRPGRTIAGASGLGGAGGSAGLPLRDNGILGGRPVTSGGPSSSIPRGTVIGGEGAQAAGRGMGGGMGMGGGSVHGGVSGSMAGRRLATEPGGVFGGRQPGAGSRSISGGQPFTQGGSGLLRGGSGAGPAGGPVGHGGTGTHAPGRRGEVQRGERPDYLAEDEETWQGDHRVIPPVID